MKVPNCACGLLLFLPDNLFTGYEYITLIAEKSVTTSGTDCDFLVALGAMSLHVNFVVNSMGVTFFAEKPGSFRGKFLHHFRTAFKT
jgi:hypothetical protein